MIKWRAVWCAFNLFCVLIKHLFDLVTNPHHHPSIQPPLRLYHGHPLIFYLTIFHPSIHHQPILYPPFSHHPYFHLPSHHLSMPPSSILPTFSPSVPVIQSFCGAGCESREAEQFLQKAIYSTEGSEEVVQREDILQHVKMATGRQQVFHLCTDSCTCSCIGVWVLMPLLGVV